MTSALPHPLSGTASRPRRPRLRGRGRDVQHRRPAHAGRRGGGGGRRRRRPVRPVRRRARAARRRAGHRTRRARAVQRPGCSSPPAGSTTCASTQPPASPPSARARRWAAVVAAAAEHGLAPVIGSSVTVGVVGYLLGGGLGPLARSHGFSSDHVARLHGRDRRRRAGRGERRRAPRPVLGAARRQVRPGRGDRGAPAAGRARPRSTPARCSSPRSTSRPRCAPGSTGRRRPTRGSRTSVAIIRFPPLDAVPAPLRGRRLLSLRFAYPGPAADGERAGGAAARGGAGLPRRPGPSFPRRTSRASTTTRPCPGRAG